MTTQNEKKVLREIQEVFDEYRKDLISDYKKLGYINIAITHGYVPAFRAWFPEGLDRKFMELSDDAVEEVGWMFEEFEKKLGDEGINIIGDEGDGTIFYAMDDKVLDKYIKKMYGEDEDEQPKIYLDKEQQKEVYADILSEGYKYKSMEEWKRKDADIYDFEEDDEDERDWKTEMSGARTKEEARQLAIDFQKWQSEQSLSYGELSEYQSALRDMAKRFGLVREFTENGLI